MQVILELVVGEGKPPESRHLKRVWFEMWARMIKMDDGFDLEPLTYMHIHAYLGTEGFNDSNDNYIRARIAASPFVSCHSPDYDCVAIMSSPHHELGRSVLFLCDRTFGSQNELPIKKDSRPPKWNLLFTPIRLPRQA